MGSALKRFFFILSFIHGPETVLHSGKRIWSFPVKESCHTDENTPKDLLRGVLATPLGVWREHAVIDDEVDVEVRSECGELVEELQRLKGDVTRSITPWRFELPSGHRATLVLGEGD